MKQRKNRHIALIDVDISWTMISSLAAVAGVIASAVIFWKSFSRMKSSEQIKMAHDIGNNLTLAENEIKKAGSTGDKTQLLYGYMQYLNVWEWYSFLVNKGQITIKEIIDYHKPTMLKDYNDIFTAYPALRDDNTKYKEFKELCEKFKS